MMNARLLIGAVLTCLAAVVAVVVLWPKSPSLDIVLRCSDPARGQLRAATQDLTLDYNVEEICRDGAFAVPDYPGDGTVRLTLTTPDRLTATLNLTRDTGIEAGPAQYYAVVNLRANTKAELSIGDI